MGGDGLVAPRLTNRKRLLLFFIGVTLVFFLLTGRLGYIQIIQGEELQERALNQWTSQLPVAPKRGVIYDRNKNILAQSASAETIAARPSEIDDPKAAASQLEPILDISRETLIKRLSDKAMSEVWLKRQVSKEIANEVRNLNIKGIVFTEESKRYYPNKNLASHILGFTGIDGEGQDGIELYYDDKLKGSPGKIVTETDVDGRVLPYNVDQYIPPEDGLNLILTIDQTIQHFTEKAVSDAMEKYRANKVYAIVMEPTTGEILGMASRPDFDPNKPPRNLGFNEMQRYVKNINCKDNLDPGSTFKIITSAAGLEEGVITPDSTFNCPGYKMVDGVRIKCWRSWGHGHQTFVEGVQNSCNPIFMETALRLGTGKFYEYLEKFGLGQKTGIDVMGEERGVVMNKDIVKNVDLARMGFGQAIATTPIQLITAVSAVINGGNLMEPHIGKGFIDGDGNVVESIEPKVIRRVISEANSDIMKYILEQTVVEGSGRNAYIPGYRVGGKTGTAQKYGEDGRIVQDKHIASFIGFAPANDPKVIVLFLVDEPVAPIDFGSQVAAPYVKMILEDVLKYMDVELQYEHDEELKKIPDVKVPELIGTTLEDASQELRELNLIYSTQFSGSVIKDQMPKPGATVKEGTKVILYLEMGEDTIEHEDGIDPDDIEAPEDDHIEDGMVAVPDLKGKSLVEANKILTSKGLMLKVEGSGIAIWQSIEPGERIEPGSEVLVRFETE